MNARPEFFVSSLASVDPEMAAVFASENQRQEDHIELIAFENYASKAVMEAQGSQLTNKYAEGYPGRRYYGGCEYVDIAAKAVALVKRSNPSSRRISNKCSRTPTCLPKR